MKQLGEAQAHHEHEIEAAIRGVPGWHGRAVRYAPVGGGISNANWRVEVDGAHTAYFCKVPGQGTEMFIDRRTAHEASVKAAQTGHGAPVFAFLEERGVEIFEFMEGWHASSNLDFLARDVRHNALRALKAFNDQPPLAQTKTVFDMIDEHYEQVRALGGYCPEDHAWIYRQYQQARAALEAAGLDLVPCFNDPMPGNFLVGPDNSIKLIDFEYASNNERMYDLAIWACEHFFPEEIEQEIIEDYFGRYDRSLHARFIVHKALADIKWSTWSMIQNRISTLDFDFYKYGIWKHMRARSIMQDPRWPLFLKAL